MFALKAVDRGLACSTKK